MVVAATESLRAASSTRGFDSETEAAPLRVSNQPAMREQLVRKDLYRPSPGSSNLFPLFYRPRKVTKPGRGVASDVIGRRRASMSTAKAKLHTELARVGKKCRYETWQLPQPELVATEGNPETGLLEFNKEDPMFACTLHLPDGVAIYSSNFRRKKDAEQDAALLALQKMGISYEPGALQETPKELWDGLLRKLTLAFTDQMVLSYKPLLEHFRAAVEREGPRSGQVPVTVLTVLDAKITSQCKSIDSLAENNPAHAAALVSRAAAACPSLKLSEDGLWIGRLEPFSPELVRSLFVDREDVSSSVRPEGEESLDEAVCSSTSMPASSKALPTKQAVSISASADKEAGSINLTAAPDVYYLDAIAHALGVLDAGHVFISRQIAKALDGSRLFWGVRGRLPWVNVSGVEQVEPLKQYSAACSKDGPMETLRNPRGQTLRNERASFLVGHPVFGDAILATVGSTWASEGRCIYHDLTLSSFHRLMVGRTPWGAYKLSRGSLLVADLPKVYTCKGHWQGASPKSLLADFIQQHRLPESQYTYKDSVDGIANEDSSEGEGQAEDGAFSKPLSPGSIRQGPFQCRVQVGSSGNDLQRFDFESDGYLRSRHDATQSAALRTVVSYGAWSGTCCLCSYFQNQDCSKLNGDLPDIASSTVFKAEESSGQTEFQVVAEEDVLGDRPPPGAFVSVDYSVHLIQEGSGSSYSRGTTTRHALESQSDFKFELGVGAVISQFESCVSKSTVGQTLRFCVSAEALGVLFSASSNFNEYQPGWVLEYTVKLLKFEEAMEDRIESSHFSPPLSKQRIEYARTLINSLEAKTLVDLGCGSGSLLEALLREPTTLEHMIGIDISRKALIRGAKTLSATLTKQSAAHGIRSITLYDGSISDMDPDLRSPDLATCIEVVEHMDPEPLSKLGESVLGQLVPKLWLVSTPNIEYNPIIRGLEWDPKTNSLKGGSQHQVSSESAESKNKMLDVEIPNLRNHDHRFEWTRAEFREWASHLAEQFGYEVSFAGVGGDGEDDYNSPGFATQIAVFAHQAVVFPKSGNISESNRILSTSELKKQLGNREAAASPLKELWQWTLPELTAAVL